MKRIITIIIIPSVISVALFGGTIYKVEKQLNNQIEENKQLKLEINDLDNIIKELNLNLNDMDLKIQEKDKQIEQLKKEKEELTKKRGRIQEFILTFYTTLPQENGGYTTTCNGEIPRHGMVASNYYPQGTKIKINGKIFTVADRGGKSFNKPNRLDVVVERKSGESDSEYLKRVRHLGKKKVTGYILEN